MQKSRLPSHGQISSNHIDTYKRTAIPESPLKTKQNQLLAKDTSSPSFKPTARYEGAYKATSGNDQYANKLNSIRKKYENVGKDRSPMAEAKTNLASPLQERTYQVPRQPESSYYKQLANGGSSDYTQGQLTRSFSFVNKDLSVTPPKMESQISRHEPLTPPSYTRPEWRAERQDVGSQGESKVFHVNDKSDLANAWQQRRKSMSTLQATPIQSYSAAAIANQGEEMRIESIDKINSKIKSILKVINQVEAPKGSAARQTASAQKPCEQIVNKSNYSRDYDYLKSRETSGHSFSYNEKGGMGSSYLENNTVSQRYLNARPPLPPQEKTNYEVRVNREVSNSQASQTRSNSVSPITHNTSVEQASYKRTYDYGVAPKKESDLNANRSCSQTPNPKVGPTTDNFMNQRSRNLDLEIQRIQEKIKKSEEEKKKLNMKFEEIKSGRLAPQGLPESSLRSQLTKRAELSEQKAKSTHESSIPRPASRTSIKQTPTEQIQHSVSQFNLNQDESKVGRIVREYGVARAQKLDFKIMPVVCETDESISSRSECIKVTEALKQQVVLDEAFRNAKMWLESCADPAKNSKIKSILENQYGINMSESEVESTFKNSLEEHNPFYNPSEVTETLDSVVAKYVKAIRYWNDCLQQHFDREKLSAGYFKVEKMDLERKGYLTVEDFVRYLNMETGTFYRNRDLILFFRRVAKDESRLTFQNLLDGITSE